jgi:hypothetical protein
VGKAKISKEKATQICSTYINKRNVDVTATITQASRSTVYRVIRNPRAFGVDTGPLLKHMPRGPRGPYRKSNVKVPLATTQVPPSEPANSDSTLRAIFNQLATLLEKKDQECTELIERQREEIAEYEARERDQQERFRVILRETFQGRMSTDDFDRLMRQVPGFEKRG